MEWHFRHQFENETTRDPIISEFFSVDAIDNPSNALVREGIQNALDAQREKTVKINIHLVTGEQAPPIENISRWFNGALDHYRAPHNGLGRTWKEQEKCSYLVFEDFGTSGLLGDETQAYDKRGNDNHFFYFFRAEGRSGKGEKSLGRWGIGKHVFPRSSNISTYFGFTVRSDDQKKLLMGRTILKSHKLAGKQFSPDGYFGEQNQINQLVLPVSKADCITSFCKDFRVSRKSEPGLSIVVPYLDSEITYDQIKIAVISGYFIPILNGRLVVEIETPENSTLINRRSILDETTNLKDKKKDNLTSTIELAEWAISHSAEDEYGLYPCKDSKPKWDDDLIPKRYFSKMRSDLENGRMMRVRAKFNIQEKGELPESTHFEVYLRRDGSELGRPIFIRNGMIISAIRPKRTRGIRSLVIIKDKPLATLLGDAENPAHTQWQKYSSNFKDKYNNGNNCINFVTDIVYNLVNSLGAQEEQEDFNLLIDYFSLPVEETEDHLPEEVSIGDNGLGDTSGRDKIKVTSKKQAVQISKIQGGFKINQSNSNLKFPSILDIKVAYDVRRGNPIKRYHSSDFSLEKDPINFQDSMKGITIKNIASNHIVAEIHKPDFQIVVTGFDEKRDLYVKTQVTEVSDDSEI